MNIANFVPANRRILLDSMCVCTVDFEHSVLRVWEIYALDNVVFYIAVYGAY